MNKRNKILVGCLALLLVLSVGYALFSETITINGTATAKGDFEITTTCQAGFTDELVNTGIYTSEIQSQNNFSDESCQVNGNKVTFNTTLSQPGAERYFTVKLTNTGTIPATLDTDKMNDDYLLSNKTIKICPLSKEGAVSTNCTDKLVYVNDAGNAGSGSVSATNEVGFMNGREYCDFFDGCVDNFTHMDTNDSVYYAIPIGWPEDYASGYEYGFQATVSVEIPLIQYTGQ